MFDTVKKESQAKMVLAFFILLTSWWLINQFIIGNQNIHYDGFFDFGEFYGYMAFVGGACGLFIAQKWGGLKSLMGKAIYMFSFGLFAQEFGQLAYAWYNDIYKTAGPYPSLGDIGFFGSILLYIFGVLFLAKASGAAVNLRSFQKTIVAIVIPTVGLIASYYFFLKGYEFDWSAPVTIFLDFGYPLGQALYVSLAILAYTLSRGVLGGVMKGPIRFIIVALIFQYFSDFSFLFANSHSAYVVGGFIDYLYLVSYTLMTLGLLQFYTVLKNIKTTDIRKGN